MRSAAAGDRRAFCLLYKRHARYVAGVAYRLLGSAAEVDDIVQETFIAALKGLKRLDEPAAFRRWLVTIAVRQVKRRIGRKGKQRQLDRALSEQLTESTDADMARQMDDLYEALSDLDVKLRIPWLLARLEGHALSDVAEECSISLATAKRRIAQAEERIRRRLGHG